MGNNKAAPEPNPLTFCAYKVTQFFTTHGEICLIYKNRTRIDRHPPFPFPPPTKTFRPGTRQGVGHNTWWKFCLRFRVGVGIAFLHTEKREKWKKKVFASYSVLVFTLQGICFFNNHRLGRDSIHSNLNRTFSPKCPDFWHGWAGLKSGGENDPVTTATRFGPVITKHLFRPHEIRYYCGMEEREHRIVRCFVKVFVAVTVSIWRA